MGEKPRKRSPSIIVEIKREKLVHALGVDGIGDSVLHEISVAARRLFRSYMGAFNGNLCVVEREEEKVLDVLGRAAVRVRGSAYEGNGMGYLAGALDPKKWRDETMGEHIDGYDSGEWMVV
tara:strand:+ start:262 stop:624 length:363 start_codon:yes stop_codon:yes gene_type:complete